MISRRAVLYQCIVEYLSIIKPHIRNILLHKFPDYVFQEAEAIKWILEEELELIYGLFAISHIHNQYPFTNIHNKLELSLPVSLSIITSAYIKAPQIYSDNGIINVRITEFDLVIEYHTDISKLRFPKGINQHGFRISNRNNKTSTN